MSRARLDSLRPLTELGLDLRQVRHFGGLPLFMWRAAASDVAGWIAAMFDRPEQFRHEAMLCYFAGYLDGRRSESGALRPAVAG